MSETGETEQVHKRVQAELALLEPITRSITDAGLRDEVLRLLSAEILARLSLDQIALEPYEQPDYEGAELDMWEAMAKPVRSAIVALHELRELIERFAPEQEQSGEVDVSFDLVDEAEPVAAVRDNVAQQVDDWLLATLGDERAPATHKSPEALRSEVQTALEPLARIIVTESLRFAGRLRNPNIVTQRWALLADLQEFRGKFLKLLGALRIGILHPFTQASEAELLANYRTEQDNAVALRQGLAALERDSMAMIAAHAQCSGGERRFVLEGLLVRLMRFARSEAFTLLRAPDKRSLIEFRKSLATFAGSDQTPRALTELLDGYAKFLEMMHAINQREVLQVADANALRELRQRLDVVREVTPLDIASAKRLFDEARLGAVSLSGRDPGLDVWLEGRLPVDSRDDLGAILLLLDRAMLRLIR